MGRAGQTGAGFRLSHYPFFLDFAFVVFFFFAMRKNSGGWLGPDFKLTHYQSCARVDFWAQGPI